MLFVAVSGYVDPLDPDIEIVVPDDDSGLYAIDILDPSWVSLLKVIYYGNANRYLIMAKFGKIYSFKLRYSSSLISWSILLIYILTY